MRPYLLEAGRLITAREAERRVLILENPGLRGASSITHSLYAGLQLILPGEVAPSHRHSQSALRFVVEGEGAYTAVDGERTTMHPGDFIITPSWTFHDHGNPGNDPVIWLDGLDIPMVAFFDAGFAERHPQEVQPVTRPEGHALARYGANMLPLEHAAGTRTTPIFNYPYARSREALEQLRRGGATRSMSRRSRCSTPTPRPAGSRCPRSARSSSCCPAGSPARRIARRTGRCTASSKVMGEASSATSTFAWGPHDVFVVPSWCKVAHQATDEAVLFSFSDRPVQKALDLWREEAPSGGKCELNSLGAHSAFNENRQWRRRNRTMKRLMHRAAGVRALVHCCCSPRRCASRRER